MTVKFFPIILKHCQQKSNGSKLSHKISLIFCKTVCFVYVFNSAAQFSSFFIKLEEQNWLDFSRSYLEMPLVSFFFFAHSIIASSLFGNDLKRFGSQLRNSSRNQLKMLPKHDCLGCHIEFLPKFS